jgi:hypothetical protein
MPLVTIEDWESTKRTSKARKEYDCVVFTGIKHGYKDAPDEPWEKAMVPWADKEWIDEIQSYPKGSKLLIRNKQDGEHWKIVAIEPWGGAEKSNPEPDVPQGDGTPPVIPNVPVIQQELIARDNTMIDCMSEAVALVTGMMDNAETFKSLIKKSASKDLIVQLTKDMANELYREVKAKENEVKSDSSEVKSKSEDLEEVEVPMD